MSTVRPLDPDPRLWSALEGGPLLRRMLVAFYDRVFEDERLSPFFASTTKEWVIDHQYAFLTQILTGEKTYFGERPRNAHHWMVISDELFDHRERLFGSIAREHGLSEEDIARFGLIHEAFRSHIVKDAPYPKKRGGVALPLEGWDRIAMSAGGMCDGCQCELAIDEIAHFHVRTGRTLCGGCAEREGVLAEEAAG